MDSFYYDVTIKWIDIEHSQPFPYMHGTAWLNTKWRWYPNHIDGSLLQQHSKTCLVIVRHSSRGFFSLLYVSIQYKWSKWLLRVSFRELN